MKQKPPRQRNHKMLQGTEWDEALVQGLATAVMQSLQETGVIDRTRTVRLRRPSAAQWALDFWVPTQEGRRTLVMEIIETPVEAEAEELVE